MTTNLLNTLPQYVVISLIVLFFLIVIGVTIGVIVGIYKFFDTVKYYIKRKFDSIGNYTSKSCLSDDKPPDTYKKTKKKYKENVSGLESKVMPDEQVVINIVDKLNELRRKK